MSGIPVLNNSFGYGSLSYTVLPNVPGSTTRDLLVQITGAYYSPSLTGATSIINTLANSGDVLFLRESTLNSAGATGPNILIITDSLGNGSTTFTINKGQQSTNYSLIYAPNSYAYTSNDGTNPIEISLSTPIVQEPDGILSVKSQNIITTGATAGILQLFGVNYDGFTAQGLTAGIVIYQQRQGSTGVKPAPYSRNLTYNTLVKVQNSTQYTVPNLNTSDGNYWFATNNPTTPPIDSSGNTGTDWILCLDSFGNPINSPVNIGPLSAGTVYQTGQLISNGTQISIPLNTVDNNYYYEINSSGSSLVPLNNHNVTSTDWINVGPYDPTTWTHNPYDRTITYNIGNLCDSIVSVSGSINPYIFVCIADNTLGVSPDIDAPTERTAGTHWLNLGQASALAGISTSAWSPNIYTLSSIVHNSTVVGVPFNTQDNLIYGLVNGPFIADGSNQFPGTPGGSPYWIPLTSRYNTTPVNVTRQLSTAYPYVNNPAIYKTGEVVINNKTFYSTPTNVADYNYWAAINNPTNHPLNINNQSSSDWISLKTNGGDVSTANSIAKGSYTQGQLISNDTQLNKRLNTQSNDFFICTTTNTGIPPLDINGQGTTAWFNLGAVSPILAIYGPYDSLKTYNKGNFILFNSVSGPSYFICILNGTSNISPNVDSPTPFASGSYWFNMGTTKPNSSNPWDSTTSFNPGYLIQNNNTLYGPINNPDNLIYALIGSNYNLDGSNPFPGSNTSSSYWLPLTSSDGTTSLSVSNATKQVISYDGKPNDYMIGNVVYNDFLNGTIARNLNTADNLFYQVKQGYIASPNDYPLGPTGLTSNKWQLINYLTTVSGLTSGTSGTIFGNPIGAIRGFDINGNGSCNINYNLGFDTSLDDLYMLYYMGITGAVNPSYNFVSVSPFKLPMRSTNGLTTFQSSSAGTTASIFGIGYNYTGVTSGSASSPNSIYITDMQGATSVQVPIIKRPDSNNYYAQYFFAATGPTAMVLPGSYYQYVKPSEVAGNAVRRGRVLHAAGGAGPILSGATAAIPEHYLIPEVIYGNVVKDSLSTNKKTVLDLTSFNYTDADGNSIFGSSGASGYIYLVSGASGTIGTVYSGPTGIPSNSITGVPYKNSGPYMIEFSDPVPYPPAVLSYILSYYDSNLGIVRQGVTSYNITVGKRVFPESLKLYMQEGLLTQNSVYIRINKFDYLDILQDSIFSNGLTGDILLLPDYASNTVINSTPFISPQNDLQEYILQASGTFDTTQSATFYVGFKSAGSTSINTSRIPITITPSLETLKGSFLNYSVLNNSNNYNSLSFTLINFDYLDSYGHSIFYDSNYSANPHTGKLQLYSSTGVLKQEIPFVYGAHNGYRFSISALGSFDGYYIKFSDSGLNYTRQSQLIVTSSGLKKTSTHFAEGGTGFSYTGPAALQFPYVFDAAAADITQVVVLGELTAPIAFDQKVVLNVPASELQRMLVYDSGWNGGQYGLGGAANGFNGLSGTTSQFSNGFTGPNVGLFLNYVLSQVNVVGSGFTGHNGVFEQSDRLGGLDLLFSSSSLQNYQTIGNSGNTGNPWGLTTGSTGIFSDDIGVSGPQILKFMEDNNISGAGATFSSQSLLNFIPVEAIRSITQTGFQVDQLSNTSKSTGVIQDIDTTMPLFVAPLQNLFEQSVAYGRVDNTIVIPVSNVPPTLNTAVGSPWKVASHIYGVDFVDGDSLTFYIKYVVGAARRYGIDPSVVGGLGSEWTHLPALTLTFNGKSFDIPIGRTDPSSGLYGSGTTGGTDHDTELSNNSVLYTLAVQLLASSNVSNFDY